MAFTASTMTENRSPATVPFPTFNPTTPLQEDEAYHRTNKSPVRQPSQYTNGSSLGPERWQPRMDSKDKPAASARHGRQKSLSQALNTIRTRNGSLSANAHEIADALKAPISPKLIILCGIWYLTSILSNTSSKAILNALPKPVTLTVVQFAFVSSWCVVLAWLAKLYPGLRTIIPALKYGIRPPSKDIIAATLPLTLFQIGGHILGSTAIKEIPVSLVHTIKGLSPLLTVLAYRFIFNIRYSTPTYLSLVPLTVGVIMACSANFSASFKGFLYAFGSAILFVTQNIVSKSIFNEAALAESEGTFKPRKPDKLNLLCYSSGLAFLFTFPLWLYSEGFSLMGHFLRNASVELTQKPGSFDHGRLTMEFIFNGTFHFAQNLVAFILLSLVSPVTYSVASLIKRVFVICFALLWFGNPITTIQGFGISLTFLGLYLYDRAKDSTKADRKARSLQLREHNDTILPLAGDGRLQPLSHNIPALQTGVRFANPIDVLDDKKNDDIGSARPRRSAENPAPSGWLPPGFKQENTWTPVDNLREKQDIGITVS